MVRTKTIMRWLFCMLVLGREYGLYDIDGNLHEFLLTPH